MEHDYSYENDSDKRHESPPHEKFSPNYTMMDPEGRVYCAHMCHCMRNKFKACVLNIGEVKK